MTVGTNSQFERADAVAAFSRSRQTATQVRAALRGVIFGKDAVVDQALACLLARGHALLIGAPGSAKSQLMRAISTVFGLNMGLIRLNRSTDVETLVQDGFESVPAAPRRLSARDGRVPNHLVVVEDLNLAAPLTLGALLDRMEAPEGTAPQPFHVFATCSPLSAQAINDADRDRFMMQIDMGYPDADGERRVMLDGAGGLDRTPVRVASPEDLLDLQRMAVELPVGERVVEAILDLVRCARPEDSDAPAEIRHAVRMGPGPRAGQALLRLARARALIDGRPAPTLDDVRLMAPAVIKPRWVIDPNAAHANPDALMDRLLQRL
jgi:MoxR-like ATPase